MADLAPPTTNESADCQSALQRIMRICHECLCLRIICIRPDAPDRATLTELDKLAEQAATLRVGLVLGLGGGGGGVGEDGADSDDEVPVSFFC